MLPIAFSTIRFPFCRYVAIVLFCAGATVFCAAQEPGAQRADPIPPATESIESDKQEVPPPALASRPPSSPEPAPSSASLTPITWRPPTGSIRRISAKFIQLNIEWVTPREKLKKVMARSCPALELVDDARDADADFQTTFNEQTSVWTTTVKQKGEQVQRFYTFAYSQTAPFHLADQICVRSGYETKFGAEVKSRLPHGNWEGQILSHVQAGNAVEFMGSVTIDDRWVTIRGYEDSMVETHFVPISSVRGVRFVHEKKTLPPPPWRSVLGRSGDCEDGVAYCFAGGVAILGTYAAVLPLLNAFIPMQHTVELLYMEDNEPHAVRIRLTPGGYEKFAKAISRGSSSAFSVAKIAVAGPPY